MVTRGEFGVGMIFIRYGNTLIKVIEISSPAKGCSRFRAQKIELGNKECLIEEISGEIKSFLENNSHLRIATKSEIEQIKSQAIKIINDKILEVTTF